MILSFIKQNEYISNINTGNIPVKFNGTYISNVFYSADKYIKKNIDLSKDNKNIKIDASEFIDNSSLFEKYKTCKGNIILNSSKKENIYSYNIATDCNNFDTNIYNVDFMKLEVNDGINSKEIMADVFAVSDGFLVSYISDYNYSNSKDLEGYTIGITSNNILLIKIDENGILKWSSKFEDKLTSGKNKTSKITYDTIYEEADCYIVFGTLEIEKGSSFEEKYGLGTIKIMLKYTKDGTFVSKKMISNNINEDNDGLIIKGQNGLYYDPSKYESFYGIDSNGDVKNKITIKGFDYLNKTLGMVDKEGSYYFFDKGSNKKIYKYDKNGIEKWEIKLDDNFNYIKNMYIFNNKFIIEVSSSKENQELPKNNILIYNLDGSFYKFFDYNTEDKYSSFELNNITINDNNIIVKSKDWTDNNEKVLIDIINKNFEYDSRTIYKDIQFTDIFDIKQTYLDGFDNYIPNGFTIIENSKLVKYFSYGNNIIFCKYSNLK